jgi:hypothetical protein
MACASNWWWIMKTRMLMAIMVSAALLSACKSDKTVTQVNSPAAAEEKKISDGSLMTPGTPKISPLEKAQVHVGQIVPVEWAMLWGENGHSWTMFVDGVKITTDNLPLQSPQTQKGKVDIELDQPGQHQIKMTLCNDHGCTESLPLEVMVASA